MNPFASSNLDEGRASELGRSVVDHGTARDRRHRAGSQLLWPDITLRLSTNWPVVGLLSKFNHCQGAVEGHQRPPPATSGPAR